MSGARLLDGKVSLEIGAIEGALDCFGEAYKLTTQVEPQPLAAAEAGFGLSKVYAAIGKRELSSKWANYALTVYPEQLIRPFSG